MLIGINSIPSISSNVEKISINNESSLEKNLEENAIGKTIERNILEKRRGCLGERQKSKALIFLEQFLLHTSKNRIIKNRVIVRA